MRQGRLVRIAGLVMEAAGLRLPIGSTCVVEQPGQRPTEAEVVGFAGDRIFLMPTSDIHGLAPGAKVFAIDPRPPAPSFGTKLKVWRRSEDKARKMPVGMGLLGRVVDGAGRPLDKLGPLVDRGRGADREPSAEPDRSRADPSHARRRRARDQRAADGRPRPADGPVRRQRRRQERAARHDGALHEGRRDRRRADRRARPRGQGVHRADPRRRRPSRARSSWPRRPTRRR